MAAPPDPMRSATLPGRGCYSRPTIRSSIDQVGRHQGPEAVVPCGAVRRLLAKVRADLQVRPAGSLQLGQIDPIHPSPEIAMQRLFPWF